MSSAAYCAGKGLDLLVGGTLKEVQGYLLLEVWAFDATRGKIVLSSREAVEREQIYAFMPSVGKDLAGIILGSEWTQLAFDPDPPGASLYVDDILVAIRCFPCPVSYSRDQEQYGFPRGATVMKPARSLSSPGSSFRWWRSWKRRSAGSVTVTSDPTGADLYVDSVWKGKTPVSVERPPSRSRGVLSLTGFYDLPFSIGRTRWNSSRSRFRMDIGARDLLQKQARNDFYVSFGWFAVSLVVPLFSYALAIDSVEHENEFLLQGDISRAANAHLNYQLYLGGYYGGMAVSAVLFTWMIFRIVHYVSVSNGTAG